jgi:hypothetical protein
MLSDYHGSLDQLRWWCRCRRSSRGQIHIGSRKLFDHIDAYSAPRLAEYYDDDPCRVLKLGLEMSAKAAARHRLGGEDERMRALGVAVELLTRSASTTS